MHHLLAQATFAALALCARQEPLPSPEKTADEALQRAWSFLLPEERADLVEWFRAECERVGTFQRNLLLFALSLDERDAGAFPLAPPLEFYDPKVHAPGQPIPRRWLEWDDPAAKRERESMLERFAGLGIRSAWRYDWATREVQRTGDDRDPEIVFANALRGLPPQADLAQALVERELDDGSQQRVLAAFAHAYTDRAGTAYPGLTLYDAWSSGKEIEMPDVDILGVIHDVEDEWRRWIAPVPAAQHERLYERVGKLFQAARRHRGLRTALAECYLAGSLELREGYTGYLDGLHSLWDAHESTPETLAPKLPDAARWQEFLAEWAERCDREPLLGAAGVRRRLTLDHDAAQVRLLIETRLRELGALERTRLPKRTASPRDK